MMDLVRWIYKNFKTIALSRFKKPNKEQFVKDRRNECDICDFNTKNQENLSLKVRVIKWLSDFYTWITFRKNHDILGNCSACEVCSIYFKTQTEDEECPKGYWSIYTPNTSKTKRGKKNGNT